MYKEIFLRACKIYVQQYREYSFDFVFDGEKQERIGESDQTVTVRIKDAERVFERVFSEWSVGLGESYCEWNIEVKDDEYRQFVFIFVRFTSDKKLLSKLDFLDKIRVLKASSDIFSLFTTWTQVSDINSHYSLSDWFDDENDSNRFYLSWLNTGYIQYSCGKWDPWTRTLEEAQIGKLDFYAKRLGIFKKSEGKTLLDLGCGWGGMMFYMAETYGIQCKWLTLSVAQAAYVNDEIKRRRLEDLVSVEVRNIHDLEGKYDYIVSVGVMEHIADFDDLYKKIAQALNDEGKALIHAMFQTYSRERLTDPFISKYIFPWWGIPSLDANVEFFGKYFRYVNKNALPQKSYPKTLGCWYDAFRKNEKSIRKLLEEKGKVKDVEFAIRVFKHYLASAYCWLHEQELVVNILAYN